MNLAPDHPNSQKQLIDHFTGGLHRVVLTGYMGSGKTTIGSLLAARSRWQFVDTDSALEEKSGMSARNLHAKLGDEQFRQYESRIFAATLERDRVVVAPGGAIVDLPKNRRSLEELKNGLIVFLDAPFDILIDRCLRQQSQEQSTYRPMLQYLDRARAQYQERSLAYASVAHWTMDVSLNAPQDTAEIIWSRISPHVGGNLN